MKFKDRVAEILLGSEVEMIILQDIDKILLHSDVPVIWNTFLKRLVKWSEHWNNYIMKKY